MSDAAAIVRDFHEVVQLLVDLDKPAATRAAAALSRWLAGQDFDSAANLPPNWRQHIQTKARDAALDGLVRMYPDVSDNALADLIVAGVERAGSCIEAARPDGNNGYFQDLARAGCTHGARHWRRLIAESRSVGHQDDGMANPSCADIDKTEMET